MSWPRASPTADSSSILSFNLVINLGLRLMETDGPANTRPSLCIRGYERRDGRTRRAGSGSDLCQAMAEAVAERRGYVRGRTVRKFVRCGDVGAGEGGRTRQGVKGEYAFGSSTFTSIGGEQVYSQTYSAGFVRKKRTKMPEEEEDEEAEEEEAQRCRCRLQSV